MKFTLIFCLIIIIWMGKECHSLTQFNYEGRIQELQSLNQVVIKEKLKSKNPLLIHNVKLPQLSFSKLCDENPGYMIREGETYKILETCLTQDFAIYGNRGLYKDLGYEDALSSISNTFDTWMSCNKQGSLSLYKGYHAIERVQCIHTINLISVLSDSAILYLINPKHSSDISNLDTPSLKKWSHRVILKPGSILSIPSQWYYFYECKGKVIIYDYHSDTYGTYLYTLSR